MLQEQHDDSPVHGLKTIQPTGQPVKIKATKKLVFSDQNIILEPLNGLPEVIGVVNGLRSWVEIFVQNMKSRYTAVVGNDFKFKLHFSAEVEHSYDLQMFPCPSHKAAH